MKGGLRLEDRAGGLETVGEHEGERRAGDLLVDRGRAVDVVRLIDVDGTEDDDRVAGRGAGRDDLDADLDGILLEDSLGPAGARQEEDRGESDRRAENCSRLNHHDKYRSRTGGSEFRGTRS